MTAALAQLAQEKSAGNEPSLAPSPPLPLSPSPTLPYYQPQFAYPTDDLPKLLKLRGINPLYGVYLVNQLGIASREDAVGLRGAELWVRRADLPPTAPGEYYFADLIGLAAVNVEGDPLGRVAEILELPAHPVLVLRGERERLVPLVRERLIKVDLDAGRITLDWHRDD